MTVLLELPAVWLDQVVLDDLALAGGASYFRVINRIPEPDQIQIRVDSLISLDLATDAADSPATATSQVFVSVDGGPEVLAYDGALGGFQPGWDGASSLASTPDANTLRIVIDPTADFGSLQTVVVRALATSTGAQALDESWTFTIEDLTAPVLVSAKATGKKTILVSFDEPMDQSLLVDPANYTFTRLTVPAVDVVVVSAVVDTTSSVVLTLDIEMTPGASYQLQAAALEDLLGNVILPPFDSTTFVGFTPQIPDGRDFNLLNMLPKKNRDEDGGDLRLFVPVLQEVTDLLICSIDRWTDVIDPDLAPEPFVDAILCDLGNPFDFDLSLVDKRRLIRVLVPMYQQKGTAVGIVNAVRFFLGVEVEVIAFNAEGWILGEDELGDSLTEGTAVLGPGTLTAIYSFEIESPIALTPDQRVQIKEIADYMKPAHTHCVGIVEPVAPVVIDHLELGLSELGVDWLLH